MSGGSFDYNQYKIGYIADDIEKLIEKNGRKKTPQEIQKDGWSDPDWYKKYPEELHHYKYPKEVIKEFKKAVKILRKAEIYAHEIDWLISCDNGNESFLRELKEKLNNTL